MHRVGEYICKPWPKTSNRPVLSCFHPLPQPMEVAEQYNGRKPTREMNADRAKTCSLPRSPAMMPTFRKIQVVYYLSRNGHLEHPHYMELTHLAHQHPRLKDVMNRLTVLRGRAMPSLYSWSCKRSYKNGYVWNDLGENDAILPSEGGEYILKGSEIVLGCTEKLQHLQLSQGSSFQPKRRVLAPKRQTGTLNSNKYEEQIIYEEEKETHKTCSRGVSTDEIEGLNRSIAPKNPQLQQIASTLDSNSSPPSTTASSRSDNSSNTLEASATNNPNYHCNPTRIEDGDPVGVEPVLSRNSMLLNLISCGGSSSFRKSSPPALVKELPARKSCSGGGLHKEALCRAAAAAEEDEMMIRYMSENPRLVGNLAAEEKEYFSGSIAEAMANEERVVADQRPGLKRSSSYNEERSKEGGMEASMGEEETRKKKGGKGKCIPFH